MTKLESKVRTARSRLIVNRWFGQLCLTTSVAAGVFAAVAVVVRLYGWSWPMGVIAAGLFAGALSASAIWAWATRIDVHEAAAALDEAAGLRERVSSGLYCQSSDDPFARAVLADAESTSENLTVGAHIRLTWPRQMAGTSMAVILAAATLLLPAGWLNKAKAVREENYAATQQTAAVIRNRTEKIKRTAVNNPELKKIIDDLDELGNAPSDRFQNPAELRHNTLKKLDKIQDVLKQQRGSDRLGKTKEFKKMLRGLKTPKQTDTPASKLAKALAEGDFKSAREQINKMKEHLAKLSSPNDAEKLQAMQKQLEALSKQLEALADDKKLKEKLRAAGVKEEDIKRMLEHLTKSDIEEIKKQLQKQGMSQKSIDKLAKQLQKRAGASSMANQLAQALKQAAGSAGAGSTGSAMSGLSQASDQLSEMEMLEQEMNQIDSMMADVQGARNDLSKPCSQCNGTGRKGNGQCGGCSGSGIAGGGQGNGGMGPNMGFGRGGIASEEQTEVSFVKRRGKVKSVRGAIIGQFLIDGQQIKGEMARGVQEMVAAAERDATDAIERKHVPRQYHKAMKGYFSELQKLMKDKRRETNSTDEAGAGTAANSSDSSQP